MWRYALGLGIAGMASAQLLNLHLENRPEIQAEKPQAAVVEPSQPVQKTTGNQVSYAGRQAKIAMDSRGHFQTDARMNGYRVNVLVDTGATSVAINRSTAKKLGIYLTPNDFKYKVNTANGMTKAAGAVIDRIEIGRVEVRNVQAVVLEDKALSGTLLGMTFLGALRGFEVRNGELVLNQ